MNSGDKPNIEVASNKVLHESNFVEPENQGLEYSSSLENFVDIGRSLFEETANILNSVDEFQLSIIRVFTSILLICVVLIWIAWGKFGCRISERFTKSVSNHTLEDFIEENRNLKLPHDYTPRI